MGGGGRVGGGGGRGGRVWGGVRVDVNREVKFFVKIKKKKFLRGGGGGWVGGGGRGPIRNWSGGGGGSKVWGRWVMWGMGDVNKE